MEWLNLSDNKNFSEILSERIKEFNRIQKRNELENALNTVSEFILLLFDYLTEQQDDE